MPQQSGNLISENAFQGSKPSLKVVQNNNLGVDLLQKESPGSIYRAANVSTEQHDTIYSIKFKAVPKNVARLMIGKFHEKIKTETDAIKSLGDLYSSAKHLFQDIKVDPKKASINDIMELMNQKIIETYDPKQMERDVSINKYRGKYYLCVDEYFAFDDLYWISITWLLKKCKNNIQLADLVKMTIWLLNDICHIGNINGNDEDYFQRMEDEKEYYMDLLVDNETNEAEHDVDDINENLNHITKVLEEKSHYDYLARSIGKYCDKLKVPEYKKLLAKFIPKGINEKKIHSWMMLCLEAFENKWSIHNYINPIRYKEDSSGDNDNYDGCLPTYEIIRFVYDREDTDPLSGIVKDLVDQANNSGVGALLFRNVINPKQKELYRPEGLAELLTIMNFEHKYEKWTIPKKISKPKQ